MDFFRGSFDDSLFGDVHRMMRNHMRDMGIFEPFTTMDSQVGDDARCRSPRQQMIEDKGLDAYDRRNEEAVRDRGYLTPGRDPMSSMEPFGFGFGSGFFGGLMRQMEQLQAEALNDRNSHVYTHSTVVSMAPGQDRRPKYYEATESVRKAGDVKETRRSVRDSGSGLEKMEIGHHVGDRGHVIEKRRDHTTEGRIVENQKFIGLLENEAETFDKEWTRATHRATGGGRFLMDDDMTMEPQLSIEAPRRRRSRSVPRHQQIQDGPIIVEVTDESDTGRRHGGGLLGRMKELFRI